ncbi:MAG: hypothetical protein JKY50_05870 [Oleispira sp.]|nr:hypothetical protein [Oleispira sp.]MBL4880555.1 hypothetical protein [Oleispira sp.]
MELILKTIHDVTRDFPGGRVGLADSINKKVSEGSRLKPKTFSNKCNKDQPSHQLNLSDLFQMLTVMHETGHGGYSDILQAIAAEFDHHCIPISRDDGDFDISTRGVLNASMDWNRKRGDAYEKLYEALEDGRISANEYEALHKELIDDINATSNLRDLLRYLAEKKIYLT